MNRRPRGLLEPDAWKAGTSGSEGAPAQQCAGATRRFHHRKVPSKWNGRRYLAKWPSTRAMASIRAKIRERTDRRYAGRDLRDVVRDLNPVLRGWGAYFRYGNSNRQFASLDGYVHFRLSKLASVKHATRYRLRASRFNYDWVSGLGIYRLTGTVRRWAPAHA